MLIAGEWYLCDDGVTRPVLRGEIQNVINGWTPAEFLIDTGADATVLSAAVFSCLGFQSSRDTPAVEGVGGRTNAARFTTTLRFRSVEGTDAKISGPFLAVTEHGALDMSVLGRDVLNVFQLVVDRAGHRIFLVAPPHSYRIDPAPPPIAHAQP